MDITRIDPLDVDLDLADRLVAVDRASHEHAGLELPVQSGPSRMFSLQHGNDGRPVDAVWVVGPPEEPVGWGLVELPFLDNRDLARLRAIVSPAHRRAGVGTALLEQMTAFAGERDRTQLTTGAWLGTDGIGFLGARGFGTQGQHQYAVRRLDLHEDPTRWDRLYGEAAAVASGYELVRVAGPADEAMVPDLVALHEAINDAPADDGREPDAWDPDRVRAYDASMARRHQTTHRVLARHSETGEWAGMSLLCVDEFVPTVAFQEDTTVVRAHRGHRLGLLMKCEMLRWLAAERPEVAAADTWNATDNHHMIAVNERLGCRVIATNVGYRRLL
ncbi:GNAT superfamily N-acetyltransferase [Nocardioides ginsengisegetis]|uniref:GNAT superfamily N-acetyltransferase n=1 Tax=Nocardioides ginsengisegetis TaxID=661491 RepID=A0A7W3IY31_9ACTN|nr:GNAT superfamily N-acetyltransferase [Nocardioides ginsengisegetis]